MPADAKLSERRRCVTHDAECMQGDGSYCWKAHYGPFALSNLRPCRFVTERVLVGDTGEPHRYCLEHQADEWGAGGAVCLRVGGSDLPHAPCRWRRVYVVVVGEEA